MHSFKSWRWLLVGSVGRCAVVPTPATTPAPQGAELALRSLSERQIPDAISLAQVLLTALPLSLRLIAATNVPAVSSILWDEFLDNKKPQWFLDLPSDIQNYLIRQFGPASAWPTATPTADSGSAAATTTGWPRGTSLRQSSSSRSPTPSSGFSTSVPTSTFSASSASSPTSKAASTRTLAPSSSATTQSDSQNSNDPGLTKRQKIGIGLGVPFSLLVVGALVFGCCFLLRRRRRKRIEGSLPPSSPGFIPRFSFQDRHPSPEHFEHHKPLNPGHNYSSQSVNTTNWEDDGYDPGEWGAGVPQKANTFPPTHAHTPMAMHDPAPIIAAPALYHTHSSNRARGTRTSYTSLRSVAEVTEPDEEMNESPVFGRHTTPPPPRQSMRRLSQPLHMEMPITPAIATVKRKPVATSPTGTSPAAEAASRSLRRPALTMPHNHSGSSSSGLAVSNRSTSSGLGYQTDASTPISPVSDSAPKKQKNNSNNPFAGGYDYLEDYGPEYSSNGYVNVEDGLYGGNRSLDRYPDPSPTSRMAKTEWPLRNVIGSSHRRNKSPLWDRVYEN